MAALFYTLTPASHQITPAPTLHRANQKHPSPLRIAQTATPVSTTQRVRQGIHLCPGSSQFPPIPFSHPRPQDTRTYLWVVVTDEAKVERHVLIKVNRCKVVAGSRAMSCVFVCLCCLCVHEIVMQVLSMQFARHNRYTSSLGSLCTWDYGPIASPGSSHEMMTTTDIARVCTCVKAGYAIQRLHITRKNRGRDRSSRVLCAQEVDAQPLHRAWWYRCARVPLKRADHFRQILSGNE